MTDDAKLATVIRINFIGGSVMLAAIGVTAILIWIGALPWDAGMMVRLAFFGLVPTALAFVTAWAARRDLADPAGRERRYQQSAAVIGASVIVVGLAVVLGLIVWGIWTR